MLSRRLLALPHSPQQVKKYAEGKARSKVGNAVRRGASAHEYDDKVDGDSQH